MNNYREFVAALANLHQAARLLPLGGVAPVPGTPPAPDAPRVLILSPHPDDEVVVGGLALRLLRQAGMNVVNVAVTQGSNPARRAARWAELTACCHHLGFGLIATAEHGLEGINVKTRQTQLVAWAQSVQRLAQILLEQQPRVIFFPHERDWNSTHIGTHHLVVDALREVGSTVSCFTVETEFWGAMDDPNLMVELSQVDVADLITALTFHVGEVQRNPYHLLLPAWLMDNVRRGSELVGGQGGGAPGFLFATLYRLRQWRDGQFVRVLDRGRFLAAGEDPAELFRQQP